MANQSVQGLLSPFLQRQRIRAAAPFLSERILDIGAGNGALAALVSPDNYMGVEMDDDARAAAAQQFRQHRFVNDLASLEADHGFDTIVALAVIEHIKDPLAAVHFWIQHLKPGGRLVLTTPHSSFHKIHDLGSYLGLFSKAAADEHETLFDRSSLVACLTPLPLRLVTYRRFLLGANQLFVFQKSAS